MNHKFITCYFLFIVQFTVSGQSINVDSLQAALPGANDSVKCAIMRSIAWEMKSRQTDTALVYAERSLALSKKLKLEPNEAEALRTIGVIYSIRGQYVRAKEQFSKALQLYEHLNDTAGQGNALNNLGIVYNRLGFYDKAADHFHQALKRATHTGDTAMFGRIYLNLGNVYLFTKQFSKATENIQAALAIFEKQGDIQNQITALLNLGIAQDESGNYAQAISTYNKARVTLTAYPNTDSEILVYLNMGRTYSRINRPNDAVFFYQNALKKSRELNKKFGVAKSLFSLSEQDMLAGHYRAALEKVSDARKFFAEQNMGREIYYADLYLSRIYESLGNYEKASRHFYSAAAINDSLQNEQVTTKISEWEVIYETEKKDYELKIKQQENTLLQSQNENALITRNITLVITFFILLTSCILYLQFKIKSRYLREKAKRIDVELRHAEAEIAYLLEHEKVIEMEFLKLNQELDTNRKALVLKSFELLQKKGALEHVEKGIDELSHERNRGNLKEQLEILKTGLKNVKAIEDDWEKIETYFKGIDPYFFASLKAKNAKLTTNELKLCAFIKMGFSTKEIATQFNTTAKAAEISKYRLKKKFGLDKDQSLLEFILLL